jgi:hypothetical protein
LQQIPNLKRRESGENLGSGEALVTLKGCTHLPKFNESTKAND